MKITSTKSKYGGSSVVRALGLALLIIGAVMIVAFFPTSYSFANPTLPSRLFSIVPGGGCPGTYTMTVQEDASPMSGNVPLSVTFSATAQNGVSPYTYSWTFGDGSTGSGSSTTHKYTSGGTFKVVVGATDANGCAAVNSLIVSVSATTTSTTTSTTTTTTPPSTSTTSTTATGTTPTVTTTTASSTSSSGITITSHPPTTITSSAFGPNSIFTANFSSNQVSLAQGLLSFPTTVQPGASINSYNIYYCTGPGCIPTSALSASISGNTGNITLTAGSPTMSASVSYTYEAIVGDNQGTTSTFTITLAYLPTIAETVWQATLVAGSQSYIVGCSASQGFCSAVQNLNVNPNTALQIQVVFSSGVSAISGISLTCTPANGAPVNNCPFGTMSLTQGPSGTWTSGSFNLKPGTYSISASATGSGQSGSVTMFSLSGPGCGASGCSPIPPHNNGGLSFPAWAGLVADIAGWIMAIAGGIVLRKFA